MHIQIQQLERELENTNIQIVETMGHWSTVL
jgi:hypothetical protein